MTADLHKSIIHVRCATALIPPHVTLRKRGSAFQEAVCVCVMQRESDRLGKIKTIIRDVKINTFSISCLLF